MSDDRRLVWWTRGSAAALVIGLAGIAMLAAQPKSGTSTGPRADGLAALPEGHRNVGPVAETFRARLDSLERVVEASPERPEPRLALAHLLHDAHRLSEAIEHYEAYLAIEPSEAARFDLAQAYTQSGEWDRAARLMEAVLADDPSNAAALYNLGAIEAMSGDPSAAIGWWERVVETGHPEFAARARASIERLDDARTER